MLTEWDLAGEPELEDEQEQVLDSLFLTPESSHASPAKAPAKALLEADPVPLKLS